jgi:hypothetical protein
MMKKLQPDAHAIPSEVFIILVRRESISFLEIKERLEIIGRGRGD